jgi:hypothetical protein
VITEGERKAAQPAPVYMYYFTWKSPVRDGKLKAFHTLEIPFALDNVDEAKSMTGSGADRYPLQEKMSGAWAAFARTGNPNHKGLPNWPAFKTDQRATMIFDNQCKVVNDPHREERLALAALRNGSTSLMMPISSILIDCRARLRERTSRPCESAEFGTEAELRAAKERACWRKPIAWRTPITRSRPRRT